MIPKLKSFSVGLALLAAIVLPVTLSTSAYAALPGGGTVAPGSQTPPSDQPADGQSSDTGSNSSSCSGSGSSSSVVDTSCLPQLKSDDPTSIILNIVFGIAASIALLMVVIGGFRYITANGDPSGTASAKNAILYAIVGLLVVMAAYSIVTFVVKGIS